MILNLVGIWSSAQVVDLLKGALLLPKTLLPPKAARLLLASSDVIQSS